MINKRLELYMQLKTNAAEMEEERRAWAQTLHPDVRCVIGHLHGPLLNKMLERSGHLDTEYFRSLSSGRPSLGRIEPAGLYRVVNRPARTFLADWLAEAPARNRRIINSVASSGDARLDAEAWRKRPSWILA